MVHNFEQLRMSFRYSRKHEIIQKFFLGFSIRSSGFGAHRRRVFDQWYNDPKEAQKVSMIEGCSLAAESANSGRRRSFRRTRRRPARYPAASAKDDKRRKSQRLISATVFAQ
ncbi:hypothetical protein U1Q18_036682 [Sarracenia purpurea var. burkii]